MAIFSTFVHTICLITVVLFELWVVQLASKQKSRHVEIAGHNWANFATFEAQFIPTPVGWGQRQGNSCPDGFLEAGATSRDLRAGATAGSRMTFMFLRELKHVETCWNQCMLFKSCYFISFLSDTDSWPLKKIWRELTSSAGKHLTAPSAMNIRNVSTICSGFMFDDISNS